MDPDTPLPLMNGHASDKEVLYLFGGAALVLLGAGFMLTNPGIRRLLGQVKVADLVSAAGPDVERYLRLRSM